jgi:hypothetical protein
MAQTKFGSFVESWTNIAIGFAINWTANMLILPLFGFTTLTAAKAFGIGLVFTLISLFRQYVLRRYFNGLRFGNTPEPEKKWRDPVTGVAANFPFPGAERVR